MSASAVASGQELPGLAPCLAGLRTALTDATSAVNLWLDEAHPEAVSGALNDAAAALARARRMAGDVGSMIPAHSRRGRLVLRAVEQAGEALRRISAARAWQDDDDPEDGLTVSDLRRALAADLRRALATAHRAVDAAEA